MSNFMFCNLFQKKIFFPSTIYKIVINISLKMTLGPLGGATTQETPTMLFRFKGSLISIFDPPVIKKEVGIVSGLTWRSQAIYSAASFQGSPEPSSTWG